MWRWLLPHLNATPFGSSIFIGIAVVPEFLHGQESNVTSVKVGNIILLIWTFKGGFFGVGLWFHCLHPDLVYSLLKPALVCAQVMATYPSHKTHRENDPTFSTLFQNFHNIATWPRYFDLLNLRYLCESLN